MTIKELRDFVYGNYYRLIRLTKENIYYSMKLPKKIFTSICNQINRKNA